MKFPALEVLQHLRSLLTLFAMKHCLPPLERMAREVRGRLSADDVVALDLAMVARKSLVDAEFAVQQESEGRLGIDPEGPAFRALREAGLITIDTSKEPPLPVFHGTEARRQKVAAVARRKANAELQLARAAVAGAPMPEKAILAAHSAMVKEKLPRMQELLAALTADLNVHGTIIARSISQEAPKYGPRWGSHPPQYWTGASACDALAQMAADVLDTINAGVDLEMLVDDAVWERLRIDVVRECGEVVRRPLPAEMEKWAPTSAAIVTEATAVGRSEHRIDGIEKPDVPQLRVSQMPARILVTLLANGGSMSKLDVHLAHRGANAKLDPRLANLMAPKGNLAEKGLLDAKGPVVALTDEGRREGELQRARGTPPLGKN